MNQDNQKLTVWYFGGDCILKGSYFGVVSKEYEVEKDNNMQQIRRGNDIIDLSQEGQPKMFASYGKDRPDSMSVFLYGSKEETKEKAIKLYCDTMLQQAQEVQKIIDSYNFIINSVANY